jgi:hypothetical protein
LFRLNCKRMILTYEQMKERLEKMTYYKGWELSLRVGSTMGIMINIKGRLEDNFNPGKYFKFDVHSPVPPMVSKKAFDLWIDWRLRLIAIHESSERLQIDGNPIVNPHREHADRDIL